MSNNESNENTPKFLSMKRKLKWTLDQEINSNIDIPNKIKNKFAANFLNDLTLILPASYQIEDSKTLYKDTLVHHSHNKFLTNYNIDNNNNISNPPSQTPIPIPVFPQNNINKGFNINKSGTSDFSNLHSHQEFLSKQKQLISQIDEISKELKVFEKRKKRNQMISLMEKISEFIEDDSINVENLKDQKLFGMKMHEFVKVLKVKEKEKEKEKELSLRNDKFKTSSFNFDDFDFSKIDELLYKKNSSERIQNKVLMKSNINQSQVLSNNYHNNNYTNSNLSTFSSIKDNKDKTAKNVNISKDKDIKNKTLNNSNNVNQSESSNSSVINDDKEKATNTGNISNMGNISNINNISTIGSQNSQNTLNSHNTSNSKLANRPMLSKFFTANKTCYHCLGSENTITTCENCSSNYHPYCESFKGLFNIEGKSSITICNECFSAYKESNLIKKENKSLFDNCEFQIQDLSLKLKFRVPKLENYVQNINKTSKQKNANEVSKYFSSISSKIMFDLYKSNNE